MKPRLSTPPLAAISAYLQNHRNHNRKPLAGRIRKR